MNRILLSAAAIVLLSFAVSMYFYPDMPDRMATHWNEAGEVNGYMSKLWAMFLIPAMTAGIVALFWANRV